MSFSALSITEQSGLSHSHCPITGEGLCDRKMCSFGFPSSLSPQRLPGFVRFRVGGASDVGSKVEHDLSGRDR